MTTATAMDQDKAAAFGGRMMEMISSGTLMMMTSVGHEVGLFETMAGMRPATSQEIATAAGLNERYVREWLGAMTTGRIVDYDPVGARFSLPI